MAWTKGTSGNPQGRPKQKITPTNLLRRKLDQSCPPDSNGGITNQSWKAAIIDKLLHLALSGDIKAIALVFERADGKVPLRVDVTERLIHAAEEAGLDPDDVLHEADRIIQAYDTV